GKKSWRLQSKPVLMSDSASRYPSISLNPDLVKDFLVLRGMGYFGSAINPQPAGLLSCRHKAFRPEFPNCSRIAQLDKPRPLTIMPARVSLLSL
ncbi:MAG: hypothetical protein NUV73_00605, partial [Candidatus Daviesbacteria bacterium]|nr:hypothetical protein [Candidatus Daviesbacteria bacterium]